MVQPTPATTKSATNSTMPTSNNMKTATPAKLDANQVRALTEKLAYELWEKNGKKPGHEMQNWLEAEKLARVRMGG